MGEPAEALEAIAVSLVDPLNISTRDVHTLVERESGRLDRRESVCRRVDSVQRLFAHPLTPALARWLIRFARPARLEVGLAEAHRVVADIRAGTMSPAVGAARLAHTAERSWHKERAATDGIGPGALACVAAVTRRHDSLVPEVIVVLGRAGLEPTPLAMELIAEAVDQGVDYLADEAERNGVVGQAALEPRAARDLHRDRRVSGRVASGHPAGRSLRSLALGRNGLVAHALAERCRANSALEGVSAAEPAVQRWASNLAVLEAAIATPRSERSESQGAAA